MNIAAIYHRPESEFAYLYAKDKMRIRLQTAKEDVKTVALISGDHYLFNQKWYLEKEIMGKGLMTAHHDYWEIEVTSDYRRLSYAFYLEDHDGNEYFYCDQGIFPYQEEFMKLDSGYFRMPYFHEIDRFKAPEWVHKTVWYQIFPERFNNGNPANDPAGTLPWGSKKPDREDFFGGDLQGIIDKLDYLEELGITGLYLCPIFTAPSNHKYDTVDYLEVDPHFGDKMLFKELVDQAHSRGIRVMLDAVFNHLGANSWQWQDVVENGRLSKYADWFHIHSFPVHYDPVPDSEFGKNINYDTFSFVPNMPKLNTANPEVQEYLLEIAAYWIKEFDIDGWRLDVANEVDHHFWKLFHQRVLTEKPELYILGEIWHSSQAWLQGDEFHAVMNYAFTDSIKAFFLNQEVTGDNMLDGMNHQQILYRDQTNEVNFNLLDSHDTARMLTLCKGDKSLLRSIFTFMFLQKGTPCIYYGTEVGLAGGSDPDCRRCMPWGNQDQSLLAFFQQLIHLRKTYADVLSFGQLRWTTEKDRVITFQRSYLGKTLRCIFNEAAEEQVMSKKGDPIFTQQTITKEEYTIAPHGFVVELV
ncbi:alpha amylase N-terminal ig-like domain-containing protein [Candidatus Enterococcus ferrettii]|uniref:Cyclomaltodextrinase/maltogenic alpha-amylase/neopullulanase n=1 Tax=Candidatus Enterococcus ferrettii TaxID=2815324 RepID=A0ABV0EV14_9ENTE|nr:alpha-glycosidase [Enterococcus sp. 665A]